MREVAIQVPIGESEQNIDIDVKINGAKRKLKYRVEIVSLKPGSDSIDDKISILRRVIKEHETDWKVVQIGSFSEDQATVMFQKI
jgi:hypothetical protein